MIYQLKVHLDYTNPPIWRRFLVDSTILLPELHLLLQKIMGWENYHLHQFVHKEKFYSDDDSMVDNKQTLLSSNVHLNTLLRKENDSLQYEYDFGDSWMHTLKLEKILPMQTDFKPRCLEGENACPPEDFGGVWGYMEMLEVLQNPKHPEYKEYRQWLPRDFSPTRFSVEEININIAQKSATLPVGLNEENHDEFLEFLRTQMDQNFLDEDWMDEDRRLEALDQQAKNDSIDLIAEVLEKYMDNKIPDEQLAKDFIDDFLGAENSRYGEKLQQLPNIEFGNLLIGNPWDETLFQIQQLSHEDYLQMPIIELMHRYLNLINPKKPITLIPYGLPFEVVENLTKGWLYDANKKRKPLHVTEINLPVLALIQDLADEFGWTRLSQNKIEILPAGTVIKDKPEKIFRKVWEGYITKVNWAYDEDKAEVATQIGNTGLWMLLYYLMLDGATPRKANHYLDLLLHDVPVIKIMQLHKINAKTPQAWYALYRKRVFEKFLTHFGLVTAYKKTADSAILFATTDLFHKLLKPS